MTNTTAPAKTAKKEPEVQTVTMTDRRVVDFVGAKKKLIKESIVNADGTPQVRLDFRNGETRLFTLPQAMLTKFALHGAEQKLGDATAGVEAVEDCIVAVDDLIDQLYNGEWSSRKEGSANGASALLQALVKTTGKTVEQIRAYLKDRTHAEKLAMRESARLKPVIEEIEAERRAKAPQVNTDDLFAKLDAVGA